MYRERERERERESIVSKKISNLGSKCLFGEVSGQILDKIVSFKTNTLELVKMQNVKEKN